ncbi:MAG: Vacuolar protein sorting-associated protein 20 [Candelina mexicana]|nr:MAG: Vacuolar protein sorting-associated protein 20 [Candelina mexicana]
MGNTPSSHKISAQDKAILDMKIQRDKLHQYQKRITVLTDREKAIARECLLRGDKPKALLALRRKKYQESLLSQTDAQLEQLEKLTSSVEFALVQKDIVFGLQQGTNVLKEIHKEMGGLENVEKLMGEGEEAREYQKVRHISRFRLSNGSSRLQEISDMLGGRISNHDEDEVEDELEAMAQEVAGVKLPDAPAAVSQIEAYSPTAPIDLPDTPDEWGSATATERAKARGEETKSIAPAQILA